MTRIPLTKGQHAIVDAADFKALSAYRWRAYWNKGTRSFYAVRSSGISTVYMHRAILALIDPKVHGDHKNHDSLDNRRENLRPATTAQNVANRRGPNRNSKSGVRGVHWCNIAKKWIARIRVNRKKIHVGSFDTKEMAAIAYKVANYSHFGDFGGSI